MLSFLLKKVALSISSSKRTQISTFSYYVWVWAVTDSYIAEWQWSTADLGSLRKPASPDSPKATAPPGSNLPVRFALAGVVAFLWALLVCNQQTDSHVNTKMTTSCNCSVTKFYCSCPLCIPGPNLSSSITTDLLQILIRQLPDYYKGLL